MEKLNLLKKLNNFKKNVKSVKKDATNEYFKCKYATLESVLNAIEEPMNEVGIWYYQTVKIIDGLNHLCTIIYDVDNSEENIEISIPLLIPSNDMQKLGSAITYARRYGLCTILGLIQEDDDGNMATEKHGTANHNQKTETKITTQQLIDMATSKGVALNLLLLQYKKETGKDVSDVKFISQDKKIEFYNSLKEKR